MASEQSERERVTWEDFATFDRGVEKWVDFFNELDQGRKKLMSHLLERYHQSKTDSGKWNTSLMWGGFDGMHQAQALGTYYYSPEWKIVNKFFNLFHMLIPFDFDDDTCRTLRPYYCGRASDYAWARWYVTRSREGRLIIFKKMLSKSVGNYEFDGKPS